MYIFYLHINKLRKILVPKGLTEATGLMFFFQYIDPYWSQWTKNLQILARQTKSSVRPVMIPKCLNLDRSEILPICAWQTKFVVHSVMKPKGLQYFWTQLTAKWPICGQHTAHRTKISALWMIAMDWKINDLCLTVKLICASIHQIKLSAMKLVVLKISNDCNVVYPKLLLHSSRSLLETENKNISINA